MVGRAALNITGTNQTYFFFDNKYVKMHWTPGTVHEGIDYGPTEFVKEWASLKQTGFGWIDAILPIPGHDHRAYFFCGGEYARIEFTPSAPGDKVLGGVRSIDDWASLKKAGFSTVDAALRVPGTKDQAFFFSNDKYCRVSFQEGCGGDQLLDGPKPIKSGWGQIQFSTLDTLVPRHGSDKAFYAFSNSQYVQFNAGACGCDELISGPRNIPPFWPTLKQVGFY